MTLSTPTLNSASDHWDELHAKVDFLRQRESYPETTESVLTIETHMSWIFLTDRYAYKLKKPILLPFLDFRSLESRFLSSNNEVALNRPLAPDIYLGVVPLRMDSRHQFYLESTESAVPVVDWLVKMRRLPHHKMLDQAILHNEISVNAVHEAARRLSEFYAYSSPLEIVPHEYRKRYTQYIRDNYQSLSAPQYNLEPKLVAQVHESQLERIESLSLLFDERICDKRIISGHGDLRPEHVCLTSPPVFIDRLELNSHLKSVDPIDELSFLAIECAFLGRPDIGEIFFAEYEKTTGDHPPPQLVAFYKSYRACLRAKLSAWHIDDPRITDKAKWRKKAQDYLNLAMISINDRPS